jgi:lipopolysaccharide exporter
MSIGRKAAAGAAWNVATGLAVRALGLVGTLVLTRFLAPDAYGEVSVAVVCVAIATRIGTLGMGPYVIAFRSSPAAAFQAFCYHNVAIAVVCTAVSLVRHPLAAALGSPGMARYVPGLALASFLSQVSMIPSSLLMRALQFRVIALTRACGELAYTVVSVAFALPLGGATIVAGNLARSALVSAVMLVRADHREWFVPSALRWQTLKGMLSYGLPMTAANLMSTLSSQADNLLISRVWGPTVMGEYNLAYNLATLPTTQISENVGDVLLPSFAKMDDAQRRAALPRASALMALVIFPIAIGLSVVAPTAVSSLLDRRWAGVAILLTVLATLNLPHPLSWVVGSYLASVGNTRPMMVFGLARLAGITIAILTIGRISPVWACIGVTLVFQLYGLGNLAAGVWLEKLRGGPLAASVIRPLLAALTMAAAVLALRAALGSLGIGPGWPALLAEVCVGALVYLTSCAVFARRASLEFFDLARSTVRRRMGA